MPPADPADGWPLITAVKKALALNSGVRAVRIELSSCYWDPNGVPSGLPLDQLIQRPDYAAVLDMVPVVMITTYALASCDVTTQTPIYRERPMTSDELAAESAEYVRLVDVVAVKHPNTTVFLADWESENDAVGLAGAYVAHTQAWLEAVRGEKAALQQRTGVAVNIGTMFEFVDIAPVAGQFSGLLAATTDLAPNGQPLWDLLSYSSWDSIIYGVAPATNAASYASAFSVIRAACVSAGFSCDGDIVIGEVGTLRDYDPRSELLGSATWESLRQGARFVVNWNLSDQPAEEIYNWAWFGKYDSSGKITSQGLDWGSWLSNGLPSPYASATSAEVGGGRVPPASARIRPRQPMDARH
jgi:hypothetical protein